MSIRNLIKLKVGNFDKIEERFRVQGSSESRAWYVSQFGLGNFKYVGPEPDQENLKKQLTGNAERIAKGEKIYERFRRLSESMSF